MRRTIIAGMKAAAPFLLGCLSLVAAAQTAGNRQAVCQANWENCLGTAEGKNWKLSYNRCLKARSACLKGQAFTPEPSPNPTGGFLAQAQTGAEGNDAANADPATRNARCENGVRGER